MRADNEDESFAPAHALNFQYKSDAMNIKNKGFYWIHEIRRFNAFYEWWVNAIEKERMKPYTTIPSTTRFLNNNQNKNINMHECDLIEACVRFWFSMNFTQQQQQKKHSFAQSAEVMKSKFFFWMPGIILWLVKWWKTLLNNSKNTVEKTKRYSLFIL